MCVETELVYFYFQDPVFAGFLALGMLWFALDAAALWKNRPYSPMEMRLFLWGWNLAAVLGMFWNWKQGALTHVNSVHGL